MKILNSKFPSTLISKFTVCVVSTSKAPSKIHENPLGHFGPLIQMRMHMHAHAHAETNPQLNYVHIRNFMQCDVAWCWEPFVIDAYIKRSVWYGFVYIQSVSVYPAVRRSVMFYLWLCVVVVVVFREAATCGSKSYLPYGVYLSSYNVILLLY